VQAWRPLHLEIAGSVARVDFLGLGAASGCGSLVRFRVGLDDGVVAVTDHACVHTQVTRWALCRADSAQDVEVHALGRGRAGPSGPLAGPLLRAVRSSTGEVLFTFGEALIPWDTGTGNIVRDAVFVAPERASGECCPGDECEAAPCDPDVAPPDGCRWESRVSSADGFCHAVSVD
jgi:hypothetical protein